MRVVLYVLLGGGIPFVSFFVNLCFFVFCFVLVCFLVLVLFLFVFVEFFMVLSN